MECNKCKRECCKVIKCKDGQIGVCPVCDDFTVEGSVCMSDIVAATRWEEAMKRK